MNTQHPDLPDIPIGDLGSLRLIFVEDSENDVLLTVRRLHRDGFSSVNYTRVETADRLRDALSRGPWDIVLIDFSLPSFSGRDALEIVKESGHDIPCLLVTGAIDEETAVRLMRDGAADILLKSRLSRLVPAIVRERREAVIRRQKARMERIQTEKRAVLECLAAGLPLDDALARLITLLEGIEPGIDVAVLLQRDSQSLGLVASSPKAESTGVDLPEATPLSTHLERIPIDPLLGRDALRRATAAAGYASHFFSCVYAPDETLRGIIVLLSRQPNLDQIVDRDALAAGTRLLQIALERQSRGEELFAARARLETVLKNLPIAIWVTDSEGRLGHTDGETQIFPSEWQGWGGQSLLEKLADYPDALAGIREALRRETHSGQMQVGGRVLESHSRRVATDSGDQIYGVTLDITERVRLQEQLIQSAKLAAMGNLISGVAHELGNPLTGIHVLSEVLAKNPDPNVSSEATTIHELSQRMHQLIRSLLRFARRGGDLAVVTDLDSTVQKALTLTQFRLRGREIEIEVHSEPHLPLVTIRADRIEQIVINLVQNAEHALREIEPPHKIRISLERGTGETVRLVVDDNGAGVAPELRRKIFEPFFTTKSEGDGTGLGLAICRGIAEEHGGDLVYEPVESGARFVLTLPSTP